MKILKISISNDKQGQILPLFRIDPQTAIFSDVCAMLKVITRSKAPVLMLK